MRTGEGPGGRLFVGEVTDIYLTAAAAVEVDVRWLYRPDDALNATDPALHYYVSYFYDHKKQVFKPISFDKRVGVGGKAGGTPKADSPAARSAAAASPATTPRGDSKAGAPPSSAGGGGSKATKAGSDGKAAALPPAASPTSATAASPAPGGTPAPAALTPSGRPSRATRGPPSATAPAAAAAPTPPRKKRKVVDSDGDGNGDVAMSDGGGPATPATPASVPTPAPAVATPPPTVTAPPPRPATPPPTTTQFISYPWATCDAPDELGDESVASPPLSREPYICRIADFVRTARASATAPASSRVLFVSGTAGCGKTEAVRAALARATPPVVVADIDGKRLFNPMLAYSILLDAVVVARRGGRRAERVVMAPERARESLAALWPSCSPVVPADDPTPPAPDASRAEPVVVFVLADDLDVLSMRAPDVVRDFLTWHTTGLSTSGGATGEAARPVALAIVGVARRMDLPAASLSARPGTLKLLTNVAQLLVEPYTLPATKGTAAAAKGGSPVTAASPAGTTPVKAPPSSSAMNVDTPTVTAGVPPASAAKAPSPAAGIPAAGTPAAGTPAAGTPAAGTPAAGTPAAGTPAAGTPAAGTPAAGTPAAGTPAAGTPAAGTPAASSAASAAATPPSTVAAGPQTPFVVTAADMRGAIKCSAPGTVAATLAAASGSPYALSTAELVVLASAALLCRDAPWVPPPTRFGHAVTLSLSGVVSKAASVAPLAVKGGQALGVQAVHAAAFGLAARGMLAVLPQADNLRPLRGGFPDCDLILTAPVAVVVTGLRAGPLAKLFVSSDVGPVQ
ncbi:hypothetical protein I4F81_000539 [Pyropia yezoensis]|uniref:Uncharacterized protein n=1 Tax=Pyropia yezoensis TaxID=2788 RepID=A0ACC3BIY6_PYRYE|nr:hypothetical protein I4F81_000539 [Neopyropia yezoensis]